MKGDWQLLRQEVIQFLVRQSRVYPGVFFAQIAYVTFVGALDVSVILLGFAILFMIIQRVNYFWYIGILVQPALGYLTVANLLAGLISCNQRWRIWLFLYVVVFFATYSQQNLHTVYNIIALTGLSLETYLKLPFQTVSDNRQYFSGFLCMLTHFGLKLFLNVSGLVWDNVIYCNVALIMAMLAASTALMNKRIQSSFNCNFDDIENPCRVYHFIRIIDQKSRNPLQRVGIERIHKSNCKQVDCFCKTESSMPFDRLYIRKLIKSALKRFQTFQFKESLQELRVGELMKDNQFPLAVQSYLKQNNFKWDAFKEVKLRRTRHDLMCKLKQIQSTYVWKTTFDDPFEYQKKFEELRRYIMELVALKIQFWQEMIKKSIKAERLKTLGKQFIDKLNKMNQFYLQNIVEVENETKVHSGGILYNLFLLTATNYKQLAQANIKNLRKSNQSCEYGAYKLGIMKVSLTKERIGQIENINNSLVKILNLNLPKVDYIGKVMDFIVPQPYLQAHINGIQRVKECDQRHLIGRLADTIFVVTQNKTIVTCSMFMRFSSDIYNELSVIGLLKHQKNDSEYILIDGEGVPQYKSDDQLDVKICNSREIQGMMKDFKMNWKNTNEANPVYQCLEPLKIQMKYKDQNYVCIMSSPLCGSFKFPKKPPIHLTINNQTQNYFNNQDIGEEADMGALKKIQVILEQNQTDSQASGISRRSQIIEILRMFQSTNGVKLFRNFNIAIWLVLLTAIVLVSLQYFLTNIAWLNPYDDTLNTIQLYSTHFEIQYWIAGFINKGMSLYGIFIGTISNASYSSAYGSTNYSVSTLLDIKTMCMELASLMYNKNSQEQKADPGYLQAMLNQILISVPSGEVAFKFNNLLSLAVSNCYQMSNGKDFWTLAIRDIYWQHIYPYYFNIFDVLQKFITSQLEYNVTLNYALFFGLSSVIVLFTVPIYFGNKKVKSQEDYIFDLMASISPELIQKDIRDLADLEINLKANHSETFQFEDKDRLTQDLVQGQAETDRSGLKVDASGQNRRRTGELDTQKNSNPRILLYMTVLVFVGFMLGVFIVRLNHISGVQQKFQQISQLKRWRNQRLDLLINIKKRIYRLSPDELISNQTLQAWIRNTLEYRRYNYVFKDSLNPISGNCSLANTVCNNATLSQLTINVLTLQLMTASFVGNTAQYLGTVAVLKDLSKQLNDRQSDAMMSDIQNMTIQAAFYTRLLYLLAWAALVVSGVVVVLHMRQAKKEYVYLTRFITFLTEEMIKKNKRVQSYLQRLAKSG